MRITVLGMGRMGRALAHRLLSGDHSVTVWNRSAEKTKPLVDAGAQAAESIKDAVADAEIVITSLADDGAVRAVALGDAGVRGSLADEAVYVDASTISPALGAELAATFPRFAQMPILASPDSLANGEAALLLGADDSVADRVLPVVRTLSGRVRRYPDPAQALAGKVANNLLLDSGVAMLAEAFAVARAGGLNDEQIRDLLGGSPLVAPGVRNRFDKLLQGATDGWWTTKLAAKDARLARDLGGGDDRLPITSAVADRYQQAADAGYADADMIAIGRLYH
jgi:3-hydroxyisobutyrate dehydrogenase-like beta-hydroxyacid dehydrogenase